MPEARLTDIKEKEILAYLGYRGHEPSPEVRSQIERCRQEVLKAAVPRLIYKRFAVSDCEVQGMPLGGNDIKKHLANCFEAVVFAATLGPKIDSLIKRKSVSDMSDAVVIDACATAAIENVCDNFEVELASKETERGNRLTFRYSPGYGDLPIGTQIQLCDAINTSRVIGLTVKESMIMVPQKSVTAIIGIFREQDGTEQQAHLECEDCTMRDTCIYRSSGNACGQGETGIKEDA